MTYADMRQGSGTPGIAGRRRQQAVEEDRGRGGGARMRQRPRMEEDGGGVSCSFLPAAALAQYDAVTPSGGRFAVPSSHVTARVRHGSTRFDCGQLRAHVENQGNV